MLDLLFKIMYEDDIFKQIFILSLKSINIEEKKFEASSRQACTIFPQGLHVYHTCPLSIQIKGQKPSYLPSSISHWKYSQGKHLN